MHRGTFVLHATLFHADENNYLLHITVVYTSKYLDYGFAYYL